MRILISVIFTAYAGLLQAAPIAVENVRIWAAPESTRVVFDLSGPVDHNLTSLTDPFRTVIDISGAELKDEMSQPANADRYIRRLRSSSHDGRLRVVLDLKKFAHSKSFQLPPNEKYGHRLVIDLTGDEEEQQDYAIIDEADTAPRQVVIAIDAGHGGEDPGSIGRGGTYEKHVALTIARKLANKINSVHGMRAVLIREGDYFISLRERISKARQHKADLFISIHADSFNDSRVSGSSVYVLSQRGASSEHARWLAEQENASDLIGGVKLDDKDNILASVLLDLSQTASLEASIDVAERVLGGLRQIGKLHKPRVESAAFAVLKSPDIPSLLIETAYISNPAEEKKLLSTVFQDTLTDAILDGLQGYFRVHAPDNSIMAMNPVNEHVIVIGRGDTLSEIAQRYRVSVDSLRKENNLKSDKIRIGQKLTIPPLTVARQ
jgi:N-acetylmuramoyl-L-alanine amidase